MEETREQYDQERREAWTLYELKLQYRKPIYDPFEVFKPTKVFLKEKIRELNDQCYDLQKQKRKASETEDEEIFVFPRLDNQHQRLLRLLRDYRHQIKRNNRTTGESGGNLTRNIIDSAKAAPIENFYEGKLKKVGSNLVGKCPFHNEKTGSFVIYPEQNSWYCFGACGIGGDAISFIQKIKGLSFREAVKFIID